MDVIVCPVQFIIAADTELSKKNIHKGRTHWLSEWRLWKGATLRRGINQMPRIVTRGMSFGWWQVSLGRRRRHHLNCLAAKVADSLERDLHCPKTLQSTTTCSPDAPIIISDRICSTYSVMAESLKYPLRHLNTATTTTRYYYCYPHSIFRLVVPDFSMPLHWPQE